MKRVHIKFVVALAVAMACGGVAQAEVWTGLGDGVSYEDALNWNPSTNAFPGSTRDINSAATVVRAVDVTVNRTFVSGGGTLNVTGGSHNDSQSGNTIRNFVGRGSVGTVNQSGGTYQIGHMLSIGGGGASGNGIYSLTDGTLSVYRGSNAANIGGNYSIELGSNSAGGGDALLQISGGSMETRVGVGIGLTGIFSVLGSGATSIGIGSNGTLDGKWQQHAGGTLKMAIDGGGVTPIFIDDVAEGTIFAQFDSGSILDLGFDSVAPYAGTWTVMEVENTAITDLGLGLSGATDGGWSFKVDNSGANGLLTVSYIPEPSTLALTLIAGLVAVRARRRK